MNQPSQPMQPQSSSPLSAEVESQTWLLSTQLPWLDSVALTPGASILDIGCGPGLHLQYFERRGLRPFACDRAPEIFRFHGQIPYVREIDELRGQKFDYVFASHVLEHCPNPFQALTGWRDCLTENGTMLVVVPPYVGVTSNDHWNIGWNVGQLALFMVAAGLDCSGGLFMKTHHNICGAGKRRDFPSTGFGIKPSLPYLPAALAAQLFHSGPNDHNDHIPGDVRLADNRRFEPAEAPEARWNPARHEPTPQDLVDLYYESSSWRATCWLRNSLRRFRNLPPETKPIATDWPTANRIVTEIIHSTIWEILGPARICHRVMSKK